MISPRGKDFMQLTPQQLVDYERDGYLAVEGLLDGHEVVALRNRLEEYTHGDRSCRQIVITMEPRVERGELRVDHPGDGIRKIDELVEHDDLYCALGLHHNIVGVIEQILGPDLKMFRNSLLLKPPSVGSQKGMHQDSPYWPIEPMALCSCWFAIDDATLENGCMGVLPGGHKRGPLPHESVTDDFVIEPSAYNMDQMKMAPLKAGGGLFFHSLLPHYTAPNRSDKWRRAIALSYMSARSRFTGVEPQHGFGESHGSKLSEGPQYFHVQGKTYPDHVR